MASLRLTVLTSASDAFHIDIEDGETVEDLSAVIYSLRPGLGEEPRLAHKGKPLNKEALLKDCGIRSGDVVAVAKQAAPRAKSMSSPSTEPSTPPLEVSPLDAQSTHSSSPSELKKPSSSTIAEPLDEDAIQIEVPFYAGETCTPSETEVGSSLGTPWRQQSPLDPDEATAGTNGADSKQSDEAIAESRPTEDEDVEMKSEENPEKKQKLESSSDVADAPDKSPTSATIVQEFCDMPPVASLLAIAHRLESGTWDVHPSELVEYLRKTAAKVEVLEGAVSDSRQALMVMNHLSAHVLQGLGEGSQTAKPSKAPTEEAPRSFLVKKGDSDLQEAHRLAVQARANQKANPGTNTGGTLSAGGAPMTKEEMDKARKARVEKLEALQASKKKEQEDAAAKSRAQEAMFNSPFAGSAKPMGRF
eukprot:TRINITY_DN63577_c0_g1_i1.p1 TRINITY_DN63577_c0_g1~~TRINITY_DN63577_c0_g1_i1.p1  ORF type:complete len:418 (-),score=99.88 TRINITY_DN63577_c0_g1_i1:83-1336(-)